MPKDASVDALFAAVADAAGIMEHRLRRIDICIPGDKGHRIPVYRNCEDIESWYYIFRQIKNAPLWASGEEGFVKLPIELCVV